MYKLNRAFLYFFIITLVGSFLSYKIIVKAYDNVYDGYGYLTSEGLL